MGVFTDRLNKLVVNAVSPGRVVKVRTSRGDGIRVEFGSRGIAGLSARQLAGEVEAALAGALEGVSKGVETARGAVRAEPLHGDAAAELRRRNPKIADRRRRFRQAVRDIRAEGTAARGLVTVVWEGDTRAGVRIAPEALTRLDEAALCEALNLAVDAARVQHAEAVVAAAKQIYQFDRLEAATR
ncbi:MAG: hypothetical protein ACRDXX_08735 [Stackebrandtia sp.]